jgi:hypothetical protein
MGPEGALDGTGTAPDRRWPVALMVGTTVAIMIAAAGVFAVVSSGARIPVGWEARSFHGMTFAVPPGARTADTIVEGEDSTFRWNGPELGQDDDDAYVAIQVSDADGEIPAQDGAEAVSIPGALRVRAGIGPAQLGVDGMEVTFGGVEIFTADALVFVGVQFPGGRVGEHIADDLIASIDVTEIYP